ncbi:Baculoviral iap repeat-containing protein 3, partial [Colletotrichum scovillei]
MSDLLASSNLDQNLGLSSRNRDLDRRVVAIDGLRVGLLGRLAVKDSHDGGQAQLPARLVGLLGGRSRRREHQVVNLLGLALLLEELMVVLAKN